MTELDILLEELIIKLNKALKEVEQLRELLSSRNKTIEVLNEQIRNSGVSKTD